MTRFSTRLRPRATPGAAVVSLHLAALTLGCREAPPPPEETPPEPQREPEEVTVVPAEYATELAFVGFAQEPVRLYARFTNETSESHLTRRYAGWIESDGEWRSLATLADRLPTPRAGWRVLPGGSWRVLAADGGELAGLVYRDTLTQFRLTPGELVAEWTGETGQREALLLGRVQRGDSLQQGLLVVRRSARRLSADRSGGEDSPAARPHAQLFLLVDSLSNGLLVARDPADPDSTALAWTWVGTIGNEWTDVRVQAPPEGTRGGPLARWRIEVPEAGVTARFRLDALPDSEDAASGPRPFALSGRLDILGSDRPVAGLGVETRS